MEKIRALISSGRFKSGDRLPTEDELAKQLGIGRSSIREAIKVFNYLGVLDSQTAKGTFVCDRSSISAEALSWSILLGRDDYQDLIDTRGAIESWSLFLLAGRYAEDPNSIRGELEALEAQIDRMRKAIGVGDRGELASADYDFHLAVITGSGNQLFSAVYGVLRSFMYEEIERTHEWFGDISTIIREHEQFVEAVKSGNPCVALKTVADHIENIKKHLDDVRGQ
jgi:DNA-binding FadR family transcriptional regulator